MGPTPTHKLIAEAQLTRNPVTARVLWNIIGKRIDRALKQQERGD